jgi:acetylornithine deacetylase
LNKEVQLQEAIREWVEHHREDIVELVGALVRIPTVNEVTDAKEEAMQRLLAERLSAMGLETELYSPEEVPGFREHPAYYPGKDYTHRPNVAALWRGTGGGRSLLFSSHADTAVVAPGWVHDPWTPRLEGDRLYGLGAFDMKGGLAASVLAVRCLQELGIRPEGDVWIESVVDEEFGGANGTIAGRAKGIHTDAVIVPEPTNLAVYPATRGGALWRVTFRGNTGLSFSGESMVNPAVSAAKFIVYLEQFAKERGSKPGPAPWYDRPGSYEAGLPAIVTRLEAGDMTAPLCDVGPVECHVDIWVECYPGVTEEELKAELCEGFRMAFPDAAGEDGPEFRKMIRFLPGAQVPETDPLLQLLIRQTQAATGDGCKVSGAPFACDSFVFNVHSSSPALIMGPSGANAHAPDEYVELISLMKLIEIYAGTIATWCKPQDVPDKEDRI